MSTDTDAVSGRRWRHPIPVAIQRAVACGGPPPTVDRVPPRLAPDGTRRPALPTTEATESIFQQ